MNTEQNCFYCDGLIADGDPFIYKMINYTGIAGGIGPTGSIKSKNKSVAIPRSKRAQNIHTIGIVIKLIFLIALLILLGSGIINFENYYLLLLFSLGFLLMGGAIVQLIYLQTGVKSKLFQSSKYPEIIKLEELGYSRGGHVMISSTPLGTLVYISRWLF